MAGGNDTVTNAYLLTWNFLELASNCHTPLTFITRMSTFCPEVVRWLVLITRKAKKCKMAICAATQDLSLLFNSLLVKYAIVHVCAQSASRVWLIVTPWIVAYQAPLSMGFYRQEYWSGLPCSPPGDLPNPRIEPASPESPALSGIFFFFTTEPPGKPKYAVACNPKCA